MLHGQRLGKIDRHSDGGASCSKANDDASDNEHGNILCCGLEYDADDSDGSSMEQRPLATDVVRNTGINTTETATEPDTCRVESRCGFIESEVCGVRR